MLIKIQTLRLLSIIFDFIFVISISVAIDLISAIILSTPETASQIIIVAFIVFYFPLSEFLFGSTLGKRISFIKVVDRNGGELTFKSSLIRFAITFIIPGSFTLSLQFLFIHSAIESPGIASIVSLLFFLLPISMYTSVFFCKGISFVDYFSRSRVILALDTAREDFYSCTSRIQFLILSISILTLSSFIYSTHQSIFYWVKNSIINDYQSKSALDNLNSHKIYNNALNSQFENSGNVFKFDHKRDIILVEAGKCGLFSNFEMSYYPRLFPEDLKQKIRESNCTHYRIPVHFNGLLSGNIEKAIVNYISYKVAIDNSFYLVTLTNRYEGLISQIEIRKRIFFKINGEPFFVDGDINFSIGNGSGNDNARYTKNYSSTM